MTTTTGTGRPPSMADVAKVAGVSAQTVSRALNGHPSVKDFTRAKVLAAVDQLGYRLNGAARALSSGRSHTIGVIAFATSTYSGGALGLTIERTAHAADYQVTTAHVSSLDPTAIEAAMRRLDEQSVEGFILAVPIPSPNDAIEELTRRVPTVTIDGSRTTSSQVVAVDQVMVGELATQHLLDLGHENVWHVSGPEHWLESTGREQGWRTTLAAAGRDAPPELRGDWSPDSGYRTGLVLSRIPDVTAVFVASDEMAFGVIRAARESGRQVPDDLSVVGVDDIALAAYCSPALTTVAQPFDQIGQRAVTNLIRHLEDPAAPSHPEVVEPRLVVRDSTTGPQAS